MASSRRSRVVLFDLDGCILDSSEPALQCLNAALAEFELETLTHHDLTRVIGPPLQLTLTALLEEREASADLLEPLLETYRSHYRTASIDMALTYPGIPEAIEALERTERLGVCTSKPTRWAEPILDHLGLCKRFELIAGPGLTESESKLHTMERALAELAPVEHELSIMIGDRHHDIDAAAHHGLTSIGVTWGFGSREELQAAGAHHIVDHPNQLVDIVAGI